MKPKDEKYTKQEIDALQANWTDTMKESHAQVMSDLKSGKLSWKSISLNYVRDLGRNVIRNVLTSTDAAMTAIREKVFGGIVNKAKDVGNTIEKGAREVSGLANKILRSVGGGRRN